MDDGIAELAQVLHNHNSHIAEVMTNSTRLDFGEIQPDYGLKPNSYGAVIPRDAYFICRNLTFGALNSRLTSTVPAGTPNDGTHSHGSSGTHSHGDFSGGQHVHTDEGPHVHDVLIPEKLRSLKPGDRVLMAWVGHSAVVIDIVFPASVVGGN